MLNLRHLKSRGHYRRSNDILFTPYPTLHELSVGIIGVDREVRVELSNQGSRRKMINIHQRKLAPTLKVSPNLRVKLIQNHFSLSPHRSHNVQLLTQISWFFSLRNLSLSKEGVEEEVDVL